MPGVSGGEIGILVVCAFDDIDFAVVWPGAVTKSPEGRPGAASVAGVCGRHMFDVGDEKTMRPC